MAGKEPQIEREVLEKAKKAGYSYQEVGDHHVITLRDGSQLITGPGAVYHYSYEGSEHDYPTLLKISIPAIALPNPEKWKEEGFTKLVKSHGATKVRMRDAVELLRKTHGPQVAENYKQWTFEEPEEAEREAPAMPIREHGAAEMGFEPAPPEILPPGTFEFEPEDLTSLLTKIHRKEIKHGGDTYVVDTSISDRGKRAVKFKLEPVLSGGEPRTMDLNELEAQGVNYNMMMGEGLEILLPDKAGNKVPYRLDKIVMEPSAVHHFLVTVEPEGRGRFAGSLRLNYDYGKRKFSATVYEGPTREIPMETLTNMLRPLLRKAGVQVPEEEVEFEAAMKHLGVKKANFEWLLREHGGAFDEPLQEVLRAIGGQHAGKYDIVSITKTGTGIEELTPEEFETVLKTNGVRTIVRDHNTGKDIVVLDFGADEHGLLETKRITPRPKKKEETSIEREIVEILHSKLNALPPITWDNLIKRHFSDLTIEKLQERLRAIHGREGDYKIFTYLGDSAVEGKEGADSITIEKMKEGERGGYTTQAVFYHTGTEDYVGDIHFKLRWGPGKETEIIPHGAVREEHRKELIRILHEKLSKLKK